MGAAAYLCYSDYGVVPKINGCGNQHTNGTWYNLYTGMGPTSSESEARYDAPSTINGNEYASTNGKLASTTGNVYGVYDMSGGAWDKVAAYLDNGNGNLSEYGKSFTNTTIKYFNDSNVLNSMYSSYWNKYEVGTEEKSNNIEIVENVEYLTQDELHDKYNTSDFISTSDDNPNVKYNTARKRLTDETFNLLANVKGIGVNEITNKHSYYGVQKSNGGYTYMQSETNTGWSTATGWSGDYVLIGHGFWPFVKRGGSIYNGMNSGVLASYLMIGYTNDDGGFRPVLCP